MKADQTAGYAAQSPSESASGTPQQSTPPPSQSTAGARQAPASSPGLPPISSPPSPSGASGPGATAAQNDVTHNATHNATRATNPKPAPAEEVPAARTSPARTSIQFMSDPSQAR